MNLFNSLLSYTTFIVHPIFPRQKDNEEYKKEKLFSNFHLIQVICVYLNMARIHHFLHDNMFLGYVHLLYFEIFSALKTDIDTGVMCTQAARTCLPSSSCMEFCFVIVPYHKLETDILNVFSGSFCLFPLSDVFIRRILVVSQVTVITLQTQLKCAISLTLRVEW